MRQTQLGVSSHGWARRATATASTLLFVGAMLAGCASSPQTSTPPSSTPSPSSRPSAEPSPPPTSEWKLGPNGECDAGQLEMSLTSRPQDSGAGQFYWNLSFTNTSDVECTLSGPPSMVYLIDAGTGENIGAPVGLEDQQGVGNETVPMPPGGTAISVLHLSMAGAYDCPIVPVTELAVSPPNWDATSPVATPNEIEGCNDPTVQLVRASPVSMNVTGG